MEDTLRGGRDKAGRVRSLVLILVLMEDTLRVFDDREDFLAYLS